VSRPFSSWNRPILAEIYLCHACSYHEILRTETAGQGHRIPGVIEFPPMIKANRISGHTLVTTDLLPTIMDLLGVERPEGQTSWGLDGRSAVPALKGEPESAFNQFGRGWLFWRQPSALGGAFRWGEWKFVNQRFESHSRR
jgi:arylsulfatase A-like enzyme